MLYEVIYDLLVLALSYPQDMTGLHIYDVSGIAAPVVELEFIDPERAGSL